MFRRFSASALAWARVRPEPEPPVGAPGSIRTFRAGRNYFYLRLLGWGATQIGAVIGIVFSIGLTASVDREFEAAMKARAAPRPAVGPNPTATPSAAATALAPAPALAEEKPAPPEPSTGPTVTAGEPSPSPTTSTASSRRSSRRIRNRSGETVAAMVARMPERAANVVANWFIPFVMFLEYLGIATFLILMPFTYALARLEFEQHWYIVTDRSLRIRTGVLLLAESTMSFANIQQVEVKQGPLQRLLGLADVRVRSAGGGGDSTDEHSGQALHMGVFKSVENATEIRDLIMARLRAFREAGLGDPDREVQPRSQGESVLPEDALLAVREVLQQASALKQAVLRTPA